MVELMVTSSKRAYATYCMTKVCCSQSPCPWSRPLLTHASAGDTQTLKGRFGSVSVGSLGYCVHKVLFEPSEHLWWVWSLIVNMILPLVPSAWAAVTGTLSTAERSYPTSKVRGSSRECQAVTVHERLRGATLSPK